MCPLALSRLGGLLVLGYTDVYALAVYQRFELRDEAISSEPSGGSEHWEARSRMRVRSWEVKRSLESWGHHALVSGPKSFSACACGKHVRMHPLLFFSFLRCAYGRRVRLHLTL